MDLPEAVRWLDRLRTITDLSFDTGGDALLATVSPASPPKGVPLASRIWRFGLDGTASALTDGPNSDALPKASPHGHDIAFASDRITLGKRDLFLLDGEGGVRKLGDLPGSVEDIQWTPDGQGLVVLSADRGLNGGATTGATRLWWGKDEDPEVTSPRPALRRLFHVTLDGGRTTEVGPPDLTVWEFALTPEGAVAVVSRDASERGWYHPELVRIDFSTRVAQVAHRTAWQLQGLSADTMGRRVAFLEGWSSDRGLVAGEMRVLDLDTGALSVLAADRQSNVTALQWRDDDSLWFTGWRNLGTVHGVVRLTGEIVWQREDDAILGENPYVARIAVSPDGQAVAAIREAIGEPQEVVLRGAQEQGWHRLSDLNGEVARGYPDYPEIRKIGWNGRDGLPLEGFVYIPRRLGSGPHPMVVNIHGGPCMSTKHAFDPYNGLALAAAGYVVFVPNYRGNVGWGQAITRMNLGDPAGAEFDDILAGVERCVALGLADPDRLGITGHSYGGYLSAWAVAATDRFKAAVPVSSICDQLSSHYSCEHDFHEFINGGSLRLEAHRRIAVERSPLNRLESPTTPTLLIQGREDRCTPVGQAQEFYAALRECGVEAELVVYPREGHFLSETEHRHDALSRQVEWFDRHLRQTARA
ncbi:Dipeptidyl aminopeptidases/acylaminoacyl-peptidase [Rubellimicrobium mesophilum DSM 19309]|uniref:Dipeptidyl aminopeptidases/acylaminoacyl-peptidase n=1 Tax=Rubellimicrobium mesophilum DSM 19309 TaxID=442562 RepID=A0A017HUP9_9RHOB|nr:S9 family peptidase [Rubellimicrobium mesophilum]EYD77479.1 Dipeptidyl aminopeptidases/acylaminoacyl-peptidase [Rubellimicrobium mesophilum DSM 19309]